MDLMPIYFFDILFTDIKPVSINTAHYKHKKVLTRDARAFRLKFLKQLLNYQKELKAFNSAFDRTKHIIELIITIETPWKAYFVKGDPKEGISRRAGDADNYIKLILDFLCNEKYCRDDKKYVDNPMVNLNIDDQFIKQISIAQIPTIVDSPKDTKDEWRIHIQGQIRGITTEFEYLSVK